MIQPISNDIVRSFPLFAGLSEQEKDDLMWEGRVRHYPNGRHLFVYGDEVRSYYVICDGAVQLFRETPDGHEMTADVLLAGSTVGLLESLESQATYRFNAVAVKDTAVIEFPIAWIQENAKRNGSLAHNLLIMISRRTQTSVIEGEHKSTMSAAQQVACFLQRLCILSGYDPYGFDLPYSELPPEI